MGVPTTGNFSMFGSGDNTTIAGAIVEGGANAGTVAGTTDFNALKGLADITRFDPTYSSGATTLAQITNTTQFRGYPTPVATTTTTSTTTTTTTAAPTTTTTTTAAPTTTTTTTAGPTTTTTTTTAAPTTTTTTTAGPTTTTTTSTTTTTTAAPSSCTLWDIVITQGDIDDATGNVLDPSRNGTVYVEFIACDGTPTTVAYGGALTIQRCIDTLASPSPTIYIYQNDVQQAAAQGSSISDTMVSCS